MAKTYKSIVHLNGNLLAAVDVETTGRTPGYHEIIQIAIQPLDSRIEPIEGVNPFYQFIKPEYPERVEKKATAVHKLDINWLMTHAMDKWKVEELLIEWWESLDLPMNKTLMPVAQNWQYEAGFLKAWLGVELFHQLFHAYVADTMLNALYINNWYYMRGEKIPFAEVNLGYLCRKYKIINTDPHDALADARAEAELYKHQLNEEFLV